MHARPYTLCACAKGGIRASCARVCHAQTGTAVHTVTGPPERASLRARGGPRCAAALVRPARGALHTVRVRGKGIRAGRARGVPHFVTEWRCLGRLRIPTGAAVSAGKCGAHCHRPNQARRPKCVRRAELRGGPSVTRAWSPTPGKRAGRAYGAPHWVSWWCCLGHLRYLAGAVAMAGKGTVFPGPATAGKTAAVPKGRPSTVWPGADSRWRSGRAPTEIAPGRRRQAELPAALWGLDSGQGHKNTHAMQIRAVRWNRAP